MVNDEGRERNESNVHGWRMENGEKHSIIRLNHQESIVDVFVLRNELKMRKGDRMRNKKEKGVG